jgi:hypothetical protein
MFAGCGSAWKKPCTNSICIHVSVMRFARRRRSSGDQDATSTWLRAVPSTRSIVSMRGVVYRQYTLGTRTDSSPAKLRRKTSALRASTP